MIGRVPRILVSVNSRALALGVFIISLSLSFVDSARFNILDANKYYEFNDYNNCLIVLNNILKYDKTSVEAYRLYQDVMLEQDQFPALKKEFEDKLQINSENYLYNYLYGRLLVQDLYSIDLAERYLKKAIDINPKFPWSYLPLALISLNKNNIDKSINILEECIRNCGDFIPSYLMIVDCYQKLYGMEKAIQILEKLLEKFPNELDLSLRLINYYCNKNEIKKAEMLINKIINIHKNDYRYHRIIYTWASCTISNQIKEKLLEFYWNNYPDSSLILDVYKDLFNIYKSKNINKALKFTRDAIYYKTKIFKLKSIAYENLIEYYKNKDTKRIIQICKEVLGSNFSNPNILIQLGKLILEDGKAELAINLFEKANHSCEWNNLKNSVIMGRITRIEDRNNLILLYLNTSYLYLGKAHYAIGEYEKALEYYKQIVNTDSSTLEEIHIDMARCYISLNNNNEAMRILLNSYKKSSSPKLLTYLKEIYNKKYGNLDGFELHEKNISNVEYNYENINNIVYFSAYKGKIIIFALHRSSCFACNKIIEVLAKLEKKYENNKNIVFINLYQNNAPRLNLESIKVDRDLYNSVTKAFNVHVVPYTLIIDKKGNIRFRMAGLKNDVDLFADFKARIEILSEEK